MVQSNPDDFARPEQSFFAECFANSLIYGTAFVISYSNVWVVRTIIRFDGARLSYALVRSNCNKLVITWPLGRLTDLSPSGASSPRVIISQRPRDHVITITWSPILSHNRSLEDLQAGYQPKTRPHSHRLIQQE